MGDKGAIELSISFIVVIVIAVMILALSIGLFSGWFQQISRIGTRVTDIAQQQLIQELRKGDEKIGLTVPDRNIQKRGTSGEIGVGIKNTEIYGACFRIDVSLRAVNQQVLQAAGCSNFASCSQLKAYAESWFSFDKTRWVPADDVLFSLININVPSEAKIGDYTFAVFIGKNPMVTDYRMCGESIAAEDFDYYTDKQFILTLD